MRQIGITAALLGLFVLAACDETHDYDYFLGNPEDIDLQLRSCREMLGEAMKTGDLDDAKEVRDSQECVGAAQARKELNRRELAERTRIRKERAAERKRLETTAKEMRDAKLAAWSTLSLEDLNTLKKSCSHERFNDHLPAHQSECYLIDQAISDVKRRIFRADVERFKAMTSRERWQYTTLDGAPCRQALTDRPKDCKAAKQAEREVREELHAHFTKHPEERLDMFEECKRIYDAKRASLRRGRELNNFLIRYPRRLTIYDDPSRCFSALTAMREANPGQQFSTKNAY